MRKLSLLIFIITSLWSVSTMGQYVVSISGGNTWSPTAGSFFDAINKANATGGTITFTVTTVTVDEGPAVDGFPIGNASNLPITIDGANNVTITSTGGFADYAAIKLKNNVTLKNFTINNTVHNGIRIEGNNNTIQNLIITKSGGNGILIVSGTGNVIKSSKIGTDVTGTSNSLGNKYNGIYLSGVSGAISNTTIGGSNAGDGNIIGNNGFFPATAEHISGIRVESSSGNTIRGNFIGTNGSGSVISNNYDGITLRQGASNNIISGNTIMNNGGTGAYAGGGNFTGGGEGLAIRWNSNGNTVSSNYIGVDASGNIGGNATRGIGIEGSSNNLIGGNNASDGNTIAATKSGAGIVLETGKDNSNIDVSGTGNILYNNKIGNYNNSNTALINNGAGVVVTGLMSANKIGDQGKGNIIAYNNAIAITIDGVNATTNTIRGNSTFCNGNNKGINLLNSGNSNLGGTPPKFDVGNTVAGQISGTAPANSTVDVYVVDASCNNTCSLASATNYKQGKTWVGQTTADASGNWVWTLAGIATKTNTVVTATLANGSTSEFSICYTSCTNPSTSLSVTPVTQTICSGSGATITVVNGEPNVTYQVVKTGTTTPVLAGPTINGNATANVNFTIPTANLPVGTNSFTVQAKGAGGCTTFLDLTNQATVQVNAAPNAGVTVSAVSPVCSGSTSTVTIATQNGISYQLQTSGGINVGAAVPGDGTSKTITVPAASLPVGTNNFQVIASIAGCSNVTLTTKPAIVVDVNPDLTYAVSSNSPVCLGNTATVTIANSQVGVSYQASINSTNVGSAVAGTGSAINLTIPAASLTPAGSYVVSVFASNTGCGSIKMNNTVTVVVNPAPTGTVSVTAVSPICSGNTSTVTIATQNGVSYQLQTSPGAVNVGTPVTGDGTSKAITVPVGSLPVGTNNFQVIASIGGCSNVTLTTKPAIVVDVDPNLTYGLSSNSPICLGNQATVTIAGSQVGVSYQASISGTNVGNAVVGTGSPVTLTIPQASFATAGTYTVDVYASNTGCGTKKLTNTVQIVVNAGPKNNLTVTPPTSTICEGSAVTIQVDNSENNVSYQLQNNTTSANIGAAQNGTGGTLSFPVTSANLTPGSFTGVDYTFKIVASIAGCSTPITLTNTSKITVKKAPSAAPTLESDAPYCLSAGVTTVPVRVKNAEIGVTYQAQVGGVDKGAAVTATGTTVTLNLPVADVPQGTTFTVSVTATNSPCSGLTLTSTTDVIVNKKPSDALVVAATSPTCKGTDGVVTITTTEAGVTYKVFVGSTLAATSATSPVTIPNANLAVGFNVINVSASIAGCTDVSLLDTAGILVNDIPSKTLAVTNNGPVCQNDAVKVTVKNAQSGVNYQLLAGSTPFGTVQTGTGADLDFTIPASGLSVGNNTFGVQATVGGCATVILDATTIVVVNKGPDLTLDVKEDKTICSSDANVTIEITGTETGVTYQAKSSTGTNLGSAIVGPATIITIPASALATGANTVSISASIAGCTTSNLNETVVITKNQEINAGLRYDVVSPVCEGSGSSVTVQNPQTGVDYRVSVNGTLVGSANPTLVISTTSIPTAGDYTIKVEGFISGCAVKTIDTDHTLTVRKSLDQGIGMTGSTVCAPLSQSSTDKATITINSAQPGVTYTVKNSQDIAVKVIKNEDAVAKNLVIELPVTTLSVGGNNFYAEASNEGACNPIKLTGGVTVYVIKDNFDISYDTLVCKSSIQKAEVVVFAPGATKYNWVSRQGAVITDVSLIGDYIGERVSIDYSGIASTVTHDTIEVYASATGADCNMYKRSYRVRLVDNVITSVAPIDTVCRYVYGPDSISVNYSYYAVNAIKYKWSMTSAPDGSRFFYTTKDSSSIEVRFPVQPRNVNLVPFTFAVQPYSLCTNQYLGGQTKQGVVLATPDVNAGKDIDTTFAIYQPILLDGSKTTVEKPYTSSLNPAGQNIYQYYWRPLDNGATLNTPDKIQTYFRSDVLENSVELTVWNRNRCAVTDTVKVKVQLLVNIPNAFTPNGDGKNDVWEIKNLEYFPNNSVVIYNQWGSKVYEANPYHNNWEGTHNGEDLPIGTYYYIFDIKKEGFSPSAGSVTIVK